MVSTWIEDSCEQIDAGFFSGDAFHSKEARDMIEEYISRWQRELKTLNDQEEENV